MSSILLDRIQLRSSLAQLVDAVLRVWPEHRHYLEVSFEVRSPEMMHFSHRLGELVFKLCAHDIESFAQSYRWMCEKFNEEEIPFRRTGRYRLCALSDVIAEVYNNPIVMGHYMRGLLISQLFWVNHASVMHYYVSSFLPNTPTSFNHLEIGPGHGLLLCFAAMDSKSKTVSGWDISATSLESTRKSLLTLGLDKKVKLEIHDAATEKDDHSKFHSLVISEVLEHVEKPAELLSALKSRISAGGRIFINVPVNSPAPDHIFLWRTPEEVLEMVKATGYSIIESRFFPMTGYTEEKARKRLATISCAIIGSPTQ
jgi:2-polyprenyl-3-methyl-5-hydroxy-6-metoxy-1,4-benzoquinol methylase